VIKMEKSMNEVDLKKIEQKAYKESMQDGFTEIFAGILLIGVGFYFVVKVIFAGILLIGVGFYFAVILFAVLFFPRIVERLKRRYTYPRIGYAKLHEDPPRKTARGIFSYMLLVIVVMVVALFIIFGDISADLWYRWSPTLMGAMLTGGLIYLADKSADPRYYGIAVFGLVAGGVLSVYRFESTWTGITVYLLFMGSCFFGLGLIRFVHFLYEYPVQEEITDE